MKMIRGCMYLLFTVFVYTDSAFAGIEGNSNTFYGSGAGANADGDNDFCTFIGVDAGNQNTTGNQNTFIGYSAGNDNTTGNSNIFIGVNTGHDNTTGSNNIFIGNGVGTFNFTGGFNTFIGNGAGNNNTTGGSNTFIGHSAGLGNTTGYANTFLGLDAGRGNTTGSNNTFVGEAAGYNNTTGEDNVFIGVDAGVDNTSGNSNTFLGNSAGPSNTTGHYNTFIGNTAGFKNTAGRNNTFLGNGAGFSNTTGINNTFIGKNAGRTGTGTANVFIGSNAGFSEKRNNKLYIDNSGTSAPLIFGDFATNSLRFHGNVTITGNLTKGSGSFVQPHPTDPNKEVVYAFFEGREHAIFLRGKARLVNGKATIETPEDFRMVAGSDEDITVQFTPRSLDSKGLAAYVVTRDKIQVGELMQGTGTYAFDYFITAKRAGFENHEPIQPNTHFTADMMTKDDFEDAYAKTDDVTVSAMRALLISNGILTREGKLNTETAKKLGWNVKAVEVARN